MLVGGQAVAWWYRFFESRYPEIRDDLDIALASKDIDFAGNRYAVAECAVLLEGTPQFPKLGDHTPNTGIVRFHDSSGVPRTIDFLEAPYGLDADDIAATAQMLMLPGEVPIWVIHPQRLMESRFHNVAGLGTTHPLALRQLDASIACSRAFSRLILDSEELAERSRMRTVLKLNERSFRFALRHRNAKAVFRSHGFDAFSAVLVDDRLPAPYRDRRYPQMQSQLTTRRASHSESE